MPRASQIQSAISTARADGYSATVRHAAKLERQLAAARAYMQNVGVVLSAYMHSVSTDMPIEQQAGQVEKLLQEGFNLVLDNAAKPIGCTCEPYN